MRTCYGESYSSSVLFRLRRFVISWIECMSAFCIISFSLNCLNPKNSKHEAIVDHKGSMNSPSAANDDSKSD